MLGSVESSKFLIAVAHPIHQSDLLLSEKLSQQLDAAHPMSFFQS